MASAWRIKRYEVNYGAVKVAASALARLVMVEPGTSVGPRATFLLISAVVDACYSGLWFLVRVARLDGTSSPSKLVVASRKVRSSGQAAQVKKFPAELRAPK